MIINKLIIYTSEPFPYGMAATNRIISYAKGFIHHNKDVLVVCFRPTESLENTKNFNTKSVYENITYRYLTPRTTKSNSFLIRRFHILFSYITLFFFSLKIINRNSVSIYYSAHTTPSIILWLTNKIKGGVILKEESEHPFIYLKGKNGLSSLLFKRIHYRLFDAYLLMTKNLVNYFNNLSNKPIVHIPMTVDLDRFILNSKNKGHKIKEIIYTGVLDNDKDGIDILIRAFAGVSDKHDNIILTLYGNAPTENQMQMHLKLVKDLNISKQVSFRGSVSRDELTNKLLNAYALVLPRPDSLQARNGFPTKLGEYLATANPVLSSRVGEIPDYLTDMENAFLVKPGSVSSLEEKLAYIIENYSKAKKIGEKGREVAQLQFNNIIQTRKIISFIENTFN